MPLFISIAGIVPIVELRFRYYAVQTIPVESFAQAVGHHYHLPYNKPLGNRNCQDCIIPNFKYM